MQCCVESCGNTEKGKEGASITERITYHAFPKDPKQSKVWLKSLGLLNLVPKNRTLVCSDHFNEEDFFFTQNEIRRIKVGAVPFVKGNIYGPAALKTCKLCLSLDTKMYKIQDYGFGKMYQDIMGIPPRTDPQNRLPMGICWECTARLQSACAFRSKALFCDALLQDHLKTNADLTIIDIQNIHKQQVNLKSVLAIQEVLRFNSHNAEERAPNTFVKTEVMGIPNNEDIDVMDILNNQEIEVDVQHLINERMTIGDERSNEDIIENFPDTDFNTEIDLIPSNEIRIVEDETSFDDEVDDFSDNDNVERDIENYIVEESRKGVDKVLKDEAEIKKINFAANLAEIMETDDDELMNLANNLTSEDDDDEDEFEINLVNKTVKCVKIKERKTKKKAKDVNGELIISVKGNETPPKKKQPFRKPRKPIDENFFSMKMLSHEDLKREMLARRESQKYIMAPFKCEVCFKGFLNWDKKEWHMTKHSEQSGPIKCDICHIRVKKPRALRVHMTNRHTEEYICKLCPLVTRSRTVALGHIKYHAGNKYECPRCLVEFEKKTTLLNHLRRKHMSSSVCELCGYSFVTEKGVEIHKRVRHRFFDAKTVFKGSHCDVCDVKFLSEEAYNRHLRLSSKHITEDNPNRISNDAWIRPGRIASVRRPVIHRKDENVPVATGPITCEQCGVELESLRVYGNHFRYAHRGTQFTFTNGAANKPYMCEHCGKVFKNSTTLSGHMWVHTGQKLYKCKLCNKAFSIKWTLANHMKQHEGVQESYECRVCGKHFSLPGNLTRHMFGHTGLRPFKCDACEKMFQSLTELRAHFNHVHLKKPRPKRIRHRANKSTKSVNTKNK